jgi:flagellar basal-body rod modification protein FlgD
MAIDTVSPTSPTGAVDTATRLEGSRSRLAENFETFLSLLTTQLKNQDPLAPMDSNAFTQQIVQMTGVEQQLLTNDLLKKLVDGASGGGIAEAVNLIGKEVSTQTATATLKDGEAKWSYSLDDDAVSVKLEVLDAAGRVVATDSRTMSDQGDYDFTWHGKNSNNTQMTDGGTYRLQVTALDAAGHPVGSKLYVRGVVTGVEQQGDDTLLSIGNRKVLLSQVTSVALPQESNEDEDDETVLPPAA